MFGDRKNEIVFIGQDMQKEEIIKDLEACLATDKEIDSGKWESGYADEWPVYRTSTVSEHA